MDKQILGLHHITAIADQAQRNVDFYTKTMGLRMVKKTVNFDDPGTYHFYYGNEEGTPGTILTFFPWKGIGRGRAGTGMATEIGYSVPDGSFEFWTERLKSAQASMGEKQERFGDIYQPFTDPDGLELTLVSPATGDERNGSDRAGITKSEATKGFHSVTLSLKEIDETAKILTDVFGYTLYGKEGNRYRFTTDAIATASIIDLLELPEGKRGINTAGTNHHIAFRVKDDKIQMEYREKILSRGLNITQQIDRDYFFSLYFREPGGVLFEIATDNPGFTVDEPQSELGTHLKLPKKFEASRSEIEANLTVLT
jgi:glyoxalase family protein